LGYSDPAEDIGQLIAQFGFDDSSMKILMKGYKTKDKKILDRAKTYSELLTFSDFLWELTRVFNIKNKRVHKEYAKKYTIKSHINEAKRKFNTLKRYEIISKKEEFNF